MAVMRQAGKITRGRTKYDPSLRLENHPPEFTLRHENLNRGRYQTLASAELRCMIPP